MNLLPILTSQIKARTCDWEMEEKGRIEGFEEWRKKNGGRKGGRKMEQNHWPEEVTSNNCSVVVYLPNVGVLLINIVTELCDFCKGLVGLEIYCNRQESCIP